ncbi:MAG TPA: DUF1116 domain-containing protein [Actinomycetes bacterium]|nr:DUF1116 domain-containing protein [Actinomycetes bacterium]
MNANPPPRRDPVLLPGEVRVVNLGLPVFGDAVRAQGAAAVDVDWRIPAGGHPELVAALERLCGPLSGRVETANREVVRRLDEGTPALTGIAPAAEVVPGVDARTVLHCGPPLDWEDFCDPLRRSVRASVLAEGWASSPEDAERLVATGRVRLEPANHHAAVVPMATTLGPSAPVFVVENHQGGNRAFSGLNQGPGATAWFGMDAPAAVERLVWLRDVAAPVLGATIAGTGPVELFPLVAQGLQMGDDVHMRTQATTNLLLRHLLPQLVAVDSPLLVEVARFLSGNHLFFLNLAMAAAKAVADWAGQVADSSVVVGMARNGTTFGIRLAGTDGDAWFVAPAPPVGRALYYPGFGPEVSAPDIGDSAVLELVGLGGPAAAASPAVAAFLGGTMADAAAATEAADHVCAGRSSRFKLPLLDFRGAPIGVDVRKAVELEITPSINTGILHATAGTGQVGAGIAEAPIECFRRALLALDERLR